MKKSWLIIALGNFFIAAMLGIFLRLSFVNKVSFNYAFLTHGHSHTAMLGWVYLMLYLLIIHNFLPEEKRNKPVYSRLFWVTQLSVVGMMISFPIQGYALFSIIFSTLHIFCSYFFCYKIWKELEARSYYDKMLLKISLIFMLVSTLGVWCLGFAGASGIKNTAFYQSSIQFFLHFQFNGWFIFAVLALFVNQFHPYLTGIARRKFNYFITLLIAATILTLGLPLNWYYPSPIFYWANTLGVSLQLIALIIGALPIKKHVGVNGMSWVAKLLMASGLISLVLKITMQCLTIWTGMAAASHYIRNFTIGFIHLIMLGVINSFLFLYINRISPNGFLAHQIGKTGISIFITGFLITELILFLQGLFYFAGSGTIANYHLILLFASLLLPLGLILIILEILKLKN